MLHQLLRRQKTNQALVDFMLNHRLVMVNAEKNNLGGGGVITVSTITGGIQFISAMLK
jgi:hypothetical protein